MFMCSFSDCLPLLIPLGFFFPFFLLAIDFSCGGEASLLMMVSLNGQIPPLMRGLLIISLFLGGKVHSHCVLLALRVCQLDWGM